MPSFSIHSQKQLRTCDPLLQRLFNTVIEHYDCRILIGHRGEAEQNAAHAAGNSDKKWPNSKHNTYLSRAVDVSPWPKEWAGKLDWKDLSRFYHFAGFVQAVAQNTGIAVRWGGDWDGDGDLKDHKLVDLVHWELV